MVLSLFLVSSLIFSNIRSVKSDTTILNRNYTLPTTDSYDFSSGIGNYLNLTSNSSTMSCIEDGVLGVSLGNITFGNAFAITYTDTSGILEIGFVLENGVDEINTQTFTVTDFYHVVSLIVNGTTITEMIDGLINWTGIYDVCGNVTAEYAFGDFGGTWTGFLSVNLNEIPSVFDGSGTVWWFYPCETFSDCTINYKPLGIGTTSYALSTSHIGGTYSFYSTSSQTGSSPTTTTGLEINPPATGVVLTNFTYVFGFYIKPNIINGSLSSSGGFHMNINTFSLLLRNSEGSPYMGVSLFNNGTGLFSFALDSNVNLGMGSTFSSSLFSMQLDKESTIARAVNVWYHVEVLITPTSKSLYVDGVLDISDSYGGGTNQSSYATFSQVVLTGYITGTVDSIYLASDLGADLSSYNAEITTVTFQHAWSPASLYITQQNPYTYLETLYQNTAYTFSGYTYIDGLNIGEGTFDIYISPYSSDSNLLNGWTTSYVASGTLSSGKLVFGLDIRPLSTVNNYQVIQIFVSITSPLNYSFSELYKITFIPTLSTTPVSSSTGYGSDALINWFVIFLIIFVPPAMLGLMLGKVGFFVGLIMSIGIGAYTLIIPYWMIFLLGIALILLLFEQFEGHIPDFQGVIRRKEVVEE